MRLQSRRQQELQSSEDLTGAGGLAYNVGPAHGWHADPGQFLTVGVSRGLLDCPHNMATDSPPEQGIQKKARMEATVLVMSQPQEPPMSFPGYLVGDPGQPSSVREVTTQGHEYQRGGSLPNILEVGPHSW